MAATIIVFVHCFQIVSTPIQASVKMLTTRIFQLKQFRNYSYMKLILIFVFSLISRLHNEFDHAIYPGSCAFYLTHNKLWIFKEMCNMRAQTL